MARARPRRDWRIGATDDFRKKILTLDELLTLRPAWAAAGRSVVWTNGCFDLLHAGHVRSFADARAQGDILIVGLNSDASVCAIKGPLRPVVCEQDRAEVVAALQDVSYVTIFDDLEPSAILARLKPDSHCKGEDYADGRKPIPEQAIVEAYGGQIRFLPLREGRSTSGLIERIIKAYSPQTSE